MRIRLLQIIALSIIMITISCKSDAKNVKGTLPSREITKEATVIRVDKTQAVNTEESYVSEVSDEPTIESKIEDATKIKPKAKPKTVKVEADKKSEIEKYANSQTTKVVSATPVYNTNKPDIKPVNDSNEIITPKKEEPKEEIITAKPEKPTETVKTERPEKPVQYDVPVGYPNHKLFDGFLRSFVSSAGVVNYTGMKNKQGELDKYLTSLENTKLTTTWSRNEKLAFWINAYNAYTIKLILDNYPVNKITDLYGGKPWDHKWIKLDGKTLSLNNIENDIIRPKFNEPRIHFAVNCAAKSCPPIMNSAFTPGKLNSQLESQTKKFINNSQHNTLGKEEITISKIFDWYGVDFGDVAAFVAKYANTTVKPIAKVKFNEYNWELNGK